MSQFDLQFGKKLAEIGIERAEEKAERENPGWCAAALEFVKGYAERNTVFLAEDVRFAAQGIEALKCGNAKAWGGIMRKAAGKKYKYIYADGYVAVKNYKAHGTPATRWKSLIYQYQKKAV
jgi:hypothetical protein